MHHVSVLQTVATTSTNDPHLDEGHNLLYMVLDDGRNAAVVEALYLPRYNVAYL